MGIPGRAVHLVESFRVRTGHEKPLPDYDFKKGISRMKAVAFNGSPRRDGNTDFLLKTVLAELESEGIASEIIQVGNQRLRGCRACGWCRKTGTGRCVIDDDCLNDYLEKMCAADAILPETNA